MRILRAAYKFLIFMLIAESLLACNVPNNSSQILGVSYVTSLGRPVASSLLWSPTDSTKILVSTNKPMSRNSSVYILDTITKKKLTLVDARDGDIGASAWSPDGKHIALSVDGGAKEFLQDGLWVINTEDNSKEIIFDKYGAAFWLADADMLAILTVDYASDQNPRRISIYLMNIQTEELELVYSNQEAIAFSGFSSSPDGRYLVFSLVLDYQIETENLYIMDIQTRTVNQLTHDDESSFPVWSPRGNLIIHQKRYSVDSETISSLHIIHPDGSCDVEVPHSENASSPTWSPDGRKIAFIGDAGIYILDIDIVFGRDIYQNLCL